MKKLTTISLFIFWAITVSILVTGLVFYQNKKNSPVNTGKQSVQEKTLAGITESILSPSVVSKHNTPNDCWMIINNKVYNVTSFLNQHPGGAGTMIPYCGKEATQAFDTKDIGRPHSQNATNMLNDYFIGNLNQVLTPEKTQNQTNTNESTPAIKSPSIQVTLNSSEILKHNSINDCWMIINNKVYNVTSYISAHPGGTNTILAYCGKDGTSTFNSKGGTGHSSFANSLLGQYFIGNFNQTITTDQIQQNVQNTKTITPPVSGEGEWEDD